MGKYNSSELANSVYRLLIADHYPKQNIINCALKDNNYFSVSAYVKPSHLPIFCFIVGNKLFAYYKEHHN